MKAALYSIWCILILSCLLSYSLTVKARLTVFNPRTIRHPQPPALHHKEVGSFFQDEYMRRSSTMKKKRLSILRPETNLVATPFKVSVQGRLAHNHGHRIKEAKMLVSNDVGTQIFSKHRSESKNVSPPAMKKDIGVMAFRPSSSGHSPGAGHGNSPDSMV